MDGDTSRSSSSRTKRLTLELNKHGRSYVFHLCTRRLSLGKHGKIQYYWMDRSQLYSLRTSDKGACNFQNCLAHWWSSMQIENLEHDLDQQIHFVWALT